jgi:hypothetical protein
MKNNLITLKEASDISGYSADYIGQLIRAGKISGKQVYTNITWMTTADAVMSYKNKSKTSSSFGEKITRQKRIFGLQVNVFKMILQNFPTLKLWLTILIGILMIFFATAIYFSRTQNNRIIESEKSIPALNDLSF